MDVFTETIEIVTTLLAGVFAAMAVFGDRGEAAFRVGFAVFLIVLVSQ